MEQTNAAKNAVSTAGETPAQLAPFVWTGAPAKARAKERAEEELPPIVVPQGLVADVEFVTADEVRSTVRWNPRNCRGMQPEFHLPVRDMPAFKGMRSKPGFQWMSRTGRMVRFESRLEWFVLLDMDFDPQIVDVSSQPFRILFRETELGLLSHVPDFFARCIDGRGVVVDVKPRALLDKRLIAGQFEATAALCARVGWVHRVVSEPSLEYAMNVRWLSRFRRAPEHVDVVAPVAFDAAAGGVSWFSLVHTVIKETGIPPMLVIPALGHLAWQRELVLPLEDDMFHMGMTVTAGGASDVA